MNIQVKPQDLEMIREKFKNLTRTVLFGSRVKGATRGNSDLDICIMDPISEADVGRLQEYFQRSNLPFMVDIVVYTELTEAFQKLIDREGVLLLTTSRRRK